MRRLLLLCALAALVGCGREETPAANAPATSVVVTVDPDGTGPKAPEQARCTAGACPAVPARAFDPVSKRMACTDIYGGPQIATVEGTWRGRRVSAHFTRQNGCEIRRWELAKPLLDL